METEKESLASKLQTSTTGLLFSLSVILAKGTMGRVFGDDEDEEANSSDSWWRCCCCVVESLIREI